MPTGDESEEFDDVTRELKLAEYKTLRDEILKKMDHRTIYRQTTLTLGLVALGVGVELESSALLLVVPMITIMLGTLTIFQTIQITRVATYIRESIEKPINRRYPSAFGWQLSNEDRPTRLKESLYSSYVPNAAIPLTPSIVAIVLAWTYDGAELPYVLMTVVDFALIAYFLMVYARHRLSL